MFYGVYQRFGDLEVKKRKNEGDVMNGLSPIKCYHKLVQLSALIVLCSFIFDGLFLTLFSHRPTSNLYLSLVLFPYHGWFVTEIGF